jgi:excinuclease ABC subunit C
LIVDGGKPQISAVLKVWRKLNLSIPLIGLVKNQKHQTEKIVIFDYPGAKIKQLEFPQGTAIKNFLTNLQEEVHRYVITSHRKLHLKSILKTE